MVFGDDNSGCNVFWDATKPTVSFWVSVEVAPFFADGRSRNGVNAS